MDQDQQINDDTPRRLLSHSLVIAAAIPVLLWFSGGEALRSAWSLTLFLILYLFFCSCRFSAAGTRLTTIFLSLSCPLLLAYTTSLLSDKVGMVIMLLDSLLAAGLFGSTLAQHREGNGTEKAAAVAAATTVASPASERRDAVVPVIALLVLGCAAWIAWLVCPAAGYSVLDVMAYVLIPLAVVVFLSTTCVLLLLNGALLGYEISTSVPVTWMCLTLMLAMLSHALLGELGGFIVQWLSVLVPTVFLGYSVRLHASSEHIINTRSHCPIPPLDGNDEKTTPN